jgi:hypothetical protein
VIGTKAAKGARQADRAPSRVAPGQNERMLTWEYMIIALPQLQAPTQMPAQSAAVAALTREGSQGWEAVGMTALPDGTLAVLMKRPASE